ncbi:uncharacterized protein [Temnothorax nylanderi]|uniref:uncharacterized protein n=1 Tax=Temnothorax nylanderi TaxID=102681 RepID=UPI003A8C7CCA
MIIDRIIDKIGTVLLELELQHGQLKRLTLRPNAVIEIIRTVKDALNDSLQFKMYDIKLFVEYSSFETRSDISLYTKCYNYFLLNTNFSSRYLLKKDIMFGNIVGCWPTLSPYLFLLIIWCSNCEDLLVESLVHIPLDLCVEILEITIKYIYILGESQNSRTRRLHYLLIYKIYYKCLWLHLGTVSENVIKRINQLTMYFEMLCDWLVSFNNEFVTSHELSIKEKNVRHGIIVKNLFRCIRKCMHSKIESYSENHNLAKLFPLTYGNSDEQMNYYHLIPANKIKSIVIKFDQQLETLLLKHIKNINFFEFMAGENINDDENTTISLQNAIVMECHYFIKFMRRNEFLVTNEDLFNCLEQLTSSRKSEKSILTVQQLCNDIAKGRLYGLKELIKRYKEWDLSTLDFINNRIDMLKTNDLYVILKYLHHVFTHVHTKAEKYRVYISVLKILIRLEDPDINFIIIKYIKEHFDDKHLECLYDESCLDAFIRRISYDASLYPIPPDDMSAQDRRALIIFILLNPKEVLSKFMIYQINIELSRSMFCPYFVQECYKVLIDRYNVLMHILKDIILQRRMIWHSRLSSFLNNILLFKVIYYVVNKIGIIEFQIKLQVISADDLMNEIYIPYLNNSYFEKTNVYIIISHILLILKNGICTPRTNFVLLIIVLIKAASVLRRCNKSFTKAEIRERMQCINDILRYLRGTREIDKKLLFAIGNHVEPLDIQKMRPMMNALEIIQEYEKRCFIVYKRLRTDPKCHPKLRSYVRTFSLNREAYIRHMILHCFKEEYAKYVFDLIFVFWYHFGWANEMMAYENVMRITAEATQIVLMYVEKFPEDAFLLLLHGLVILCKAVRNTACDKLEEIRRILLRTLCSLNYIVNKTRDGDIYSSLLQSIQRLNPSIETDDYFDKIRKMMHDCLKDIKFRPNKAFNLKCICDGRYCKHYSSLIEEKVPAMYNSYLFICECLKISNREMHCYSERLLRSLCLERYLD